jgi:hypothetical protein
MDAVRTQYANVRMGAPIREDGTPDPNVFDIHVCQTWEEWEENGEQKRFPVTVTAWKPDVEEVMKIMNGGLLYTVFYGHKLPPQRLTTDSPFMGDALATKETQETNMLLHIARALIGKCAQLASLHGDMTKVETRQGVTRITFKDGRVFTMNVNASIIV